MKTTAHETLPLTAPAGRAPHPTTGRTAGRTTGRLAPGPTDPIDPAEVEATERRRLARAALKSRHASGLSRLMEERSDLRGVHALADFVEESLRWTA